MAKMSKARAEELKRLRNQVQDITHYTQSQVARMSRDECVEKLAQAGVDWAVCEVEEYARKHSCEGME